MTIQTVADDISKSLKFYTLAGIVTDAHFNKGGLNSFERHFGIKNCVFVAPGAAKVSIVVASWLGEVIR